MKRKHSTITKEQKHGNNQSKLKISYLDSTNGVGQYKRMLGFQSVWHTYKIHPNVYSRRMKYLNLNSIYDPPTTPPPNLNSQNTWNNPCNLIIKRIKDLNIVLTNAYKQRSLINIWTSLFPIFSQLVEHISQVDLDLLNKV